jgi:hypothetical protein
MPVLREVKLFLQKAKGEVVILDLHRFPVGFHGRPARHRRLVALLTRELRSIALPASSVSASTLLRDIWDRDDNRRLIVTYGDKNVAAGKPNNFMHLTQVSLKKKKNAYCVQHPWFIRSVNFHRF